jgi:hypothetical protein
LALGYVRIWGGVHRGENLGALAHDLSALLDSRRGRQD